MTMLVTAFVVPGSNKSIRQLFSANMLPKGVFYFGSGSVNEEMECTTIPIMIQREICTLSRDLFPIECPYELVECAQRCINDNRSLRPSMKDVVNELVSIKQRVVGVCSGGQFDLNSGNDDEEKAMFPIRKSVRASTSNIVHVSTNTFDDEYYREAVNNSSNGGSNGVKVQFIKYYF